jgi:hypothetical protein
MTQSRTRRAKGSASRARAHGEGSLPVETVMKITAKRSCMIRMPIATRPCSAPDSPFSSSTLTAKTVLEKLRANATRSATCRFNPGNTSRPTAPNPKRAVQRTATVISMCREAVP